MEPRNPGEEDPSQLPRPGLLLSSRAAKSGRGRLVKDADAPPLSTQPHHVPLYLKPTPAPRNLMPPLLWLLLRPPGLPPTHPTQHSSCSSDSVLGSAAPSTLSHWVSELCPPSSSLQPGHPLVLTDQDLGQPSLSPCFATLWLQIPCSARPY